jgi:subtilase family serine protease
MRNAGRSHGTGNASVSAISVLAAASLLFLWAASPPAVASQPATQPGGSRTIQLPDLTIAAVSNPPVSASPGASILVMDTTRNVASTPAPATYTRYSLSADLSVGNDIALSGQRQVPAGLVGAANTGTVTVSIPATTPSGSYYLLACADAAGTIPEANEGNNCRFSSTTILIGLPDLVLALVTTGTQVVPPGGWIRLADSTRNLSQVPTAVDTYTEYSLSSDQAIGNDTPIGKRKVSDGLVAGDQIYWNTAMTIPVSTPPGSYYVYACADATKAAPESDEGNNCRFATEKVTVGFSDLTVIAVSNPPAVAAPGDNIAVTDTTRNLLQFPSETAVFTDYYL